MAAGYCAPSQKDFKSKYLPSIKDFVDIVDYCDGGSKLVTTCDLVNPYGVANGGMIVYDWKAPTVTDVKDTLRLKELLDQAIAGQLVVDQHFEFNGLPTYLVTKRLGYEAEIIIVKPNELGAVYIGFTNHGYFYPVMPQIVMPSTSVSDINAGHHPKIASQPVYNLTLKDGIYYHDEGKCECGSDGEGKCEGGCKDIDIYRDGALLLHIDHIRDMIEMCQYDNGIITKRIVYNNKLTASIGQSDLASRAKVEIDSYTEYRNGIRHGYCYSCDGPQYIEANYDTGVLSGKYLQYNENDTYRYQCNFRKQAAITEHTCDVTTSRALVGLYLITNQDDNQITEFHFDGDGQYDGVQYEQVNSIDGAKLYTARSLGDFKCDTDLTELKKYFIHGREYKRKYYQEAIVKRLSDIQEVTKLPLDLVKMILEY